MRQDIVLQKLRAETAPVPWLVVTVSPWMRNLNDGGQPNFAGMRTTPQGLCNGRARKVGVTM